MNTEINLTKNDLQMLKKILHTLENSEECDISINFKDIVKYEYSTLESQKLIDLYNFRLSGATHKSSSIVELIERISQNNSPSIIIHNIEVKGGQIFMLYSSIDCEKIIYILPLGRGSKS